MYEKAHASLKFIRYYIALMLPYVRGTVDIGTLNYIAVDILVREAKKDNRNYFMALDTYMRSWRLQKEFENKEPNYNILSNREKAFIIMIIHSLFMDGCYLCDSNSFDRYKSKVFNIHFNKVNEYYNDVVVGRNIFLNSRRRV